MMRRESKAHRVSYYVIIGTMLAWASYATFKAATTWNGYLTLHSAAFKNPHATYKTAQECLDQFHAMKLSESYGPQMGYVCGRGCVIKNAGDKSDYLCLEESFNGEPVAQGKGSFGVIFLHEVFPWLK